MDTKPSPVNVEHDPAIKKKKKPQQRKLFVKVIDKVVTEPIKQSTNDNEDTTPSSSKITSSNNPNNSKLSKNTSTLVPSNQIKKEERRKKFATSNHQQNGAFTSKLSSPTIINQVENKQQYVSQENPPKQLLENNLKKKKNKKAKLVQQPKLKQQENAAQNSSTIQPQQQKTTRVVKQDSNEKLKNLIDTKIVQALNVLKEKEEEINKSKHHLNAEMNLKDFKNKINFFKKKRIIRKECISKEQLLKESIIESQYQNLAYFDGYLPNMTKVYYIPSLKQRAFIHNSSHQFLGDPKPFILFSDLVRTDKLYMRNITPIDLKEILHFYPQLETNMIVSKVKEELRVKLPSIVSEDLKFRNTEFIEEVERQLGHVIEIDSTDSSIKVYCDQGERFNIISQIKEVIEIAKKRALSQILELEIENGLDDDSSGLRIMVSSGCKVKGLIFPNEFTKLQVDNLPLGCDDDTLRNLFLPYHTLDARVYSSLPNDSFASGYVVFTNFSVATTVYHKFKETYKLTPVLFNTKSSNESALVRLKWNIGPNNGYCLIGFKNGNNSATINNITHDRIFSSQLGPAGLRFQIKKTKNKDTLEIRNIYDHIDAKFVKVLLDNRHIDYHFVSILRRPVVVENDLIQGVLLSKVQSFQSLEFLDILNIDTYKQFGEALVCFTDQKDAKSAAQALNSTKFMGAILWANSIHRDSVTVPTEVTELLKFELQCLIDNCKAKIKYNTSRKNAENYKTEISIQSANLEDFNEAKKNVVALVKPLSLHLTHQTIQYASRKRKQLDQIENRNQVFISINSKTRTIEIFGLIDDKHNAKEEIMQLVEGHSKTLTIHLKYLKSITGNAGKPFQELKTQFANCDISLNVKTKELIVDGNEKDQHAIQQYVTELMENYEQNHNVEHTDDDCPICFERMTNPFRTIGCNHEICKDCFRFQIQNPNSFVCSCCEMDLSISEILMYLETKQEKTYTKALEDFLLENPESYKYCPKNCGSVCRIDGSDIICQTCNLSFCKECEKKSHKGQKCGDEDKTREWMNTKTKPCPSCSQRIEKSEGCNHMRFATGQATYAHFRAGSCLTFDVPPEIIRPRQVNPPVNNQIPLQLIPQPNPQPVPARIRPLIIPPQPQQLQQPQPNNPQPQPPQRQGLLNCLVM
ncbi:predicted protein [Naegleria gruberi]|uniref:RBR-type E3 ubiquitin transferase n=1 Tax=Naegleria gruberi TaxID=5762 RepID=D2VJ97_NAEGR|nr:uncharacterized protein NAEGRDRAFT_68960 [Naegleria gruberi]EFC43245.1 predicted protein [Naegleria gruberi]|eukprot:XP_002675989.1 predicted protein [Naegleria gruberi strain NEG-M]